MTQEEKQLLLADLCARAPYKVHCRVFKLNGNIKENDDALYGIVGDNVMTLKSDKDECLMYYQIKPYLRPMSSMAEEEERKYNGLLKPLGDFMFEQEEEFKPIQLYKNVPFELYDFFNSHHLDFRGLIPMGLALEAPEDMYKF